LFEAIVSHSHYHLLLVCALSIIIRSWKKSLTLSTKVRMQIS